eukprot:CAMPEP_0174991288 /NCGR_PEP_ID=MMETSP0004_2-20121128/21809_1 /TAXON_ID=420556 /ORGANISM="Ochromonas sp., Strain CCMP1393" /LENGTH=460 /DNA_ID=CAMNT_0016245021 /DNA_START=124 /DNA_END=1504 /DNA_ORIENTATION=-
MESEELKEPHETLPMGSVKVLIDKFEDSSPNKHTTPDESICNKPFNDKTANEKIKLLRPLSFNEIPILKPSSETKFGSESDSEDSGGGFWHHESNTVDKLFAIKKSAFDNNGNDIVTACEESKISSSTTNNATVVRTTGIDEKNSKLNGRPLPPIPPIPGKPNIYNTGAEDRHAKLALRPLPPLPTSTTAEIADAKKNDHDQAEEDDEAEHKVDADDEEVKHGSVSNTAAVVSTDIKGSTSKTNTITSRKVGRDASATNRSSSPQKGNNVIDKSKSNNRNNSEFDRKNRRNKKVHVKDDSDDETATHSKYEKDDFWHHCYVRVAGKAKKQNPPQQQQEEEGDEEQEGNDYYGNNNWFAPAPNAPVPHALTQEDKYNKFNEHCLDNVIDVFDLPINKNSQEREQLGDGYNVDINDPTNQKQLVLQLQPLSEDAKAKQLQRYAAQLKRWQKFKSERRTIAEW